jgi:hypothetical protein
MTTREQIESIDFVDRFNEEIRQRFRDVAERIRVRQVAERAIATCDAIMAKLAEVTATKVTGKQP